MSRTSLAIVGALAGLTLLVLVVKIWPPADGSRGSEVARATDRGLPMRYGARPGDADSGRSRGSDGGSQAQAPGSAPGAARARELPASGRDEAARRKGAQVVSIPRDGGAGSEDSSGEHSGTVDNGERLGSLGDGIGSAPTSGSGGRLAHQPFRERAADSEAAPSDSEPVVEAGPTPVAEDGVVLDLPLADGQAGVGEVPALADGVTFDAEGAHFSTDAQFAVPNAGNVQGEAGTISFWIRPDWNGSDPNNAALVQLRTEYNWSNRISIVKGGGGLNYIFTPDAGGESGSMADIRGWQANEWHHVTATWGDGVSAFYVDGQLAGAKEYEGQFKVNPATPMLIGSDYKYDYRQDYGAAGGVLSNFKVYNRALPPDEVLQSSSQRPQQ